MAKRYEELNIHELMLGFDDTQLPAISEVLNVVKELNADVADLRAQLAEATKRADDVAATSAHWQKEHAKLQSTVADGLNTHAVTTARQTQEATAHGAALQAELDSAHVQLSGTRGRVEQLTELVRAQSARITELEAAINNDPV